MLEAGEAVGRLRIVVLVVGVVRRTNEGALLARRAHVDEVFELRALD